MPEAVHRDGPKPMMCSLHGQPVPAPVCAAVPSSTQDLSYAVGMIVIIGMLSVLGVFVVRRP